LGDEGFQTNFVSGVAGKRCKRWTYRYREKSQFEKAMNVIMASVTPQLSDLQRESLVRDYVDAKPNKGQAVELAVAITFDLRCMKTIALHDRTLEACQLRACYQ
jgi:hypothetical protein